MEDLRSREILDVGRVIWVTNQMLSPPWERIPANKISKKSTISNEEAMNKHCWYNQRKVGVIISFTHMMIIGYMSYR